MELIRKQEKTLEDYKNLDREMIKSSKKCNERDLSCSFRPIVLMAPPR